MRAKGAERGPHDPVRSHPIESHQFSLPSFAGIERRTLRRGSAGSQDASLNSERFDRNVVLGLFLYGPAAGIGGDGTNEIDIEYAFWGNASDTRRVLDRLSGIRLDDWIGVHVDVVPAIFVREAIGLCGERAVPEQNAAVQMHENRSHSLRNDFRLF